MFADLKSISCQILSCAVMLKPDSLEISPVYLSVWTNLGCTALKNRTGFKKEFLIKNYQSFLLGRAMSAVREMLSSGHFQGSQDVVAFFISTRFCYLGCCYAERHGAR